MDIKYAYRAVYNTAGEAIVVSLGWRYDKRHKKVQYAFAFQSPNDQHCKRVARWHINQRLSKRGEYDTFPMVSSDPGFSIPRKDMVEAEIWHKLAKSPAKGEPVKFGLARKSRV